MQAKLYLNSLKVLRLKVPLVFLFSAVLIGAILVYGSGTTTTISEGIFAGAPSYTIWDDGGIFKAKNHYGAIAHQGSNLTTVFDSCVSSLSSGSIYLKDLELPSNVSSYGTNIIIIEEYHGQITYYSYQGTSFVPAVYPDKKISNEQLRIAGSWGNVQEHDGIYYLGALNALFNTAYALKWTDATGSMETAEIPNLLLTTGNSHYNPNILRLSDGYLLAFSGYSLGLKCARSTNPDDITSWETPYTISSTTYIGGYSEPFQDTTTGYVYVSARNEVNDCWTIWRSTNGGATWSFFTHTIWDKDKYVVPGRMYDTDDGRKRLHWAAAGDSIVYTLQDNIYYAYSDNFGVTWKNASGSTITSIETQALVYDGNTTRVNVTIDTENNFPVILSNLGYRGGTLGSSDYESRVFVWDGSTWNNHLVYNQAFVHGFNPIVTVIDGRIHAITEFQDSSYYIATDEITDPNMFYSAYKLVDFYADAPYTTWTKSDQTIWFKQHHHAQFFYRLNEYPMKIFYTTWVDLEDTYQIRELTVRRKSPYQDLYYSNNIDTENLIDIVRIPVNDNVTFTNTGYADISAIFVVQPSAYYNLSKGNVIYRLSAIFKQDTTGMVYLKLVEHDSGDDVYGSEISTDWDSFMNKQSVALRITYSYIQLQGRVSAGTGRLFEAFIGVYAVY